MTLCDVLKKERSLLSEELFSKFGETLANFHRSTQDKARDFDKLISSATHGNMNHDETLEEDLEVFVQSRQVLNEIWPALGVSKVSNFDTELDVFEKELKQLTERRKTGLNSKSGKSFYCAIFLLLNIVMVLPFLEIDTNSRAFNRSVLHAGTRRFMSR
jgi:hypothetical protein